ncbi:MAG: hypothetical protein JW384_02283 [Nitrosomonadaceae bacterium]|nr:hypothetical protein [Nitrosomonadaceae bacterium]
MLSQLARVFLIRIGSLLLPQVNTWLKIGIDLVQRALIGFWGFTIFSEFSYPKSRLRKGLGRLYLRGKMEPIFIMALIVWLVIGTILGGIVGERKGMPGRGRGY